MSMALEEVTGTPIDLRDGSAGASGGEYLIVAERVVIAPAPGRFEPAVVAGTDVTGGLTVVGSIVRSNDRIDVISQVSGQFMGHLADQGERVRDGQPLAWVRTSA